MSPAELCGPRRQDIQVRQLRPAESLAPFGSLDPPERRSVAPGHDWGEKNLEKPALLFHRLLGAARAIQRLARWSDTNGADRFVGKSKYQLFAGDHVDSTSLQCAFGPADKCKAPIKNVAIADALQNSGQIIEARLSLEYARSL